MRAWNEVFHGVITALILGHLGRWDEAVEIATEALAAEAGHPRARCILDLLHGTLRVRRGQLEAGEADLRAAREGPTDARLSIEVCLGLAEAALARHQPETALSILREAAAESERTEEIVGRASLAALRLRAAATTSNGCGRVAKAVPRRSCWRRRPLIAGFSTQPWRGGSSPVPA